MSASSQTRPPEPPPACTSPRQVRPIAALDVPLNRLQADMKKLVTRQRVQRLAELDTLREHLPVNDPDRHALDVDADARFAAIASPAPIGSHEVRISALLATIRVLGGAWTARDVQELRRRTGGPTQRGTARRDLAELARRGHLAEQIRQFNHNSGGSRAGWEYPSHSYSALGNLSHLLGMLPQAIEQAIRPVMHTYEHGRVAIDGGGDPDQAVRELVQELNDALTFAASLTNAVGRMHSATSPMGLDTRGIPEFEDDGSEG